MKKEINDMTPEELNDYMHDLLVAIIKGEAVPTKEEEQ